MRRFVLLPLAIACLAGSPPALAQRVSGGFLVHLNAASMTGPSSYGEGGGRSSYGWERRNRLGGRVGAFLDIVVSPRFAVRTGAAYSMDGARMEFGRPHPGVGYSLSLAFEANYVEFPLLGRLKLADTATGTLSLLAGQAVAVKAREETSVTDNRNGRSYTEEGLESLNNVDYRLVIGAEAELKTGGRSLVFDLRYVRGVTGPWAVFYPYPLEATTKHSILSAGLGLRLF